MRCPERLSLIAIAASTVVAGAGCVGGGPASPRDVPAGFVTVGGTSLYLDGEPFVFRGLNIYNANSRGSCWYPMADGEALAASLDAIGPRSQNAFRAWFFQDLATTDGRRDWSGFDHTLQVAREHDQRVVVTLGNQWEDCEGEGARYRSLAWYESGYDEPDRPGLVSYRDWVAEVVLRYRDDPTVLMWQLMNEAEAASGGRDGPCEPEAAATLRAWAEDMARMIKGIDPFHLLSIGTIGTGQCGASGADFASLHAIELVDLCEYHDYGWPDDPMPGDPWNGLATRLDQCASLGKPLFVGESGIEASLADRHELFDAKLSEQLAAGVVGVLLWEWRAAGQEGGDEFVIGPDDPVLEVLATVP